MDYNTFAPMLLNFAKQTEEIHSTSDTDMKVIWFTKSLVQLSQMYAFVRINVKPYDFLLQQVSLEAAKFTSVNFACYAQGCFLFFMSPFMLYFSE